MRARRAQRGRSRWPSFPRTAVFSGGEVGWRGSSGYDAADAAARRRPATTTATASGAVAVG